MSSSRNILLICSVSAIVLIADTSEATNVQLQQSWQCTEAADTLSEWVAAQVMSYYRPRPRRSVPMRRPSVATRKKTKMRSASTATMSALGSAAPAAEMAMDKAADGPTSFTGTNVQEVAVDEADLVKTDGKFIYAANDGKVLILESWPPEETGMVARVSLPDAARPTALYLHGDTLLVLSSVRLQFSDAGATQGTRITYIDVKDRTRPAIERHVDLEGALVQSRLIGSDLYLVSNAATRLPNSLVQRGQRFMQKTRGLTHKQLAKHLKKSLTRAEINASMPHMRSHRIGGKFRQLVSCGNTYVPRARGPIGALTLTHLRLNRHEPPKTIGVLGGGLRVYASTDALYVASNTGNSQIHKFELNAGTELEPKYVGSGAISGYLLNQFSMSEHKGFLRVATTDGGGNNLFVLGENQTGNELEVVGSIKGLARGERIFAARMFGDKGYIVTFRQTDPLYTLDLSDPSDPRVVGELKINGFSSYIHPLDGDRLLTIGQDADGRGRLQGVHLQIFDVSDPSAPTRTHHQRLGQGSQSVAQNDHHAFTYDPATKTLAIPAQQYGGGGDYFSGLLVYRIDAQDGFAELGRVSHSDRVAEYAAARCKRQRCGRRHHTGQRVPMLRSIVMDHYLYSLSGIALEVNDLDNMEETVAAAVLSSRPKARATRLSMR